jgi:peptidoglycan/xylan/chitin deacetylase (PgdA/CDA1 family)
LAPRVFANVKIGCGYQLKTAITFDDISPAFIHVSKLKQLIDFLNERNVRSTLFVIPNSRGIFPLNDEFGKLLRVAISSGHEIAMHGYMHTENEFGYTKIAQIFSIPFPRYEKQRELIKRGTEYFRKLIGERPFGFRAPSYQHNNATLRALASLGFKYDSSKTVFKPTHLSYFRLRTFYPPKIIEMQGITEIPVTGDYTYKLKNHPCTCDFQYALYKAICDFKWVKRIQGVFVLNNHVSSQRFDGVLNFLNKIIRKLQQKTEFLTLKDLVFIP